MDYTKLEQYAPYIIFVVLFIWQNNIFVRPEQLEKKHREIIEDVDKKLQDYVELNAYKEFQSRVIASVDNVDKNVNELKDFLMGKGNGGKSV